MVETMGIKTGYKQTEVGVIPEDWEIKSIVENSTMKARIGWQGLTVAEYLKNGDYFLITGTDFVDRKIKWDTCHYVNKDRYVQDKNIQIRVGDILITKDGTIGKVAYVDSLPLNATLNSGVFVIRPKDNAYNPLYLFYIFNSSFFRDFLNKLVAGSTINHLYQKDFVSFQTPLPPTKAEQTAIATALNDADALITQLEKLIAKKRAIKQGAMQKLLDPMVNGELRMVNDFNSPLTTQHSPFLKEGWEMKKLGEVFEITAGGDYRKEFSSNTKDDYHIYPIYSNSLSNKGLYGYCTYFSNEPNCVTVTARGTIGYSCYRDHNFAAIGRLLVLKPKRSVDCFYFSEYINSKIEFVLEVTGVPQLTAPQISQYEVSFPKAKAEQSRIAKILSDMDAEIEALENKLNKYKMIKQGMMQNLLTGRIRLV